MILFNSSFSSSFQWNQRIISPQSLLKSFSFFNGNSNLLSYLKRSDMRVLHLNLLELHFLVFFILCLWKSNILLFIHHFLFFIYFFFHFCFFYQILFNLYHCNRRNQIFIVSFIKLVTSVHHSKIRRPINYFKYGEKLCALSEIWFYLEGNFALSPFIWS